MVDYIYDKPTQDPRESPHWKALDHREGDRCLQDLPDLKQVFAADLAAGGPRLALWSCLLGYCEALCTHRSPQSRHSVYPVPLDALRRLVDAEFAPPPPPTAADSTTRSPISTSTHHHQHRAAAQAVSNWVWGNVASKANVKDEMHANSLYIALRGRIDGKSVDCFGAALVTVIGLRQLGFEQSMLTLSEDHAYESHYEDGCLCTCEVAIPGNTKAQKAKRGQETAKTFDSNNSKKASQLTTETSWIYMGMAPVYCRTAPMILAAALANVNCMIETKQQGKMELNSEPLLLIKRELLWILKDAGHIDAFPFALCELGWSEEHCTSARGETMRSIPDLAPIPVTTIESLYHEAIVCNQTRYEDRQVYPYCYMAYFHKDGGQTEEYRFGVALKYFYHAARVAGRYSHEWADTLQLTKVLTKISEFLVREIWSDPTMGSAPRTWRDVSHAVAAARWMLAFFDALLAWEERNHDRFLPILQSNHKTGIARVFALVSHDVRVRSFQPPPIDHDDDELPKLQSARLQGALGEALQKPKVSISDLQLTIVSEGRRSRKRKGD